MPQTAPWSLPPGGVFHSVKTSTSPKTLPDIEDSANAGLARTYPDMADDEFPDCQQNTKRRKISHSTKESESEDESIHEIEPTIAQSKGAAFSHVEISPLSHSQSICYGWEAPASVVSERRLLHTALECEDDEIYLRLDDFCIYTNDKADGRHNQEFVCLSKLTADRHAEFLFDGLVSIGDQKSYLTAVPFVSLMVGYDQDQSIEQSLWIMSQLARKLEKPVYYQLGHPSREYARFYKPFLWLAQFARFFVEYLMKHEGVVLRHFRRLFLEWLDVNYQDSTTDQWLGEAGLSDFRTTVAAHHGFLWKECCGTDPSGKSTGIKMHPLWSEIDPRWLTAIPRQVEQETHTVVTPSTYNCFSRMYFASRLKARQIGPSLVQAVRERKQALRLTPLPVLQPASLPTPESMRESSESNRICPGDVVCIPPDQRSWKRSKATSWYAYVQDIRVLEGEAVMDIIWLYEASDTTIGQAHYPFLHELFLSDNCECGKTAWPVSSATGKISVSWYSNDPYSETGYFVRKKFRTVKEHDTYDFVTLQPSDFKCGCQRGRSAWIDCRESYREGDCVLVLCGSPLRLRPALLVRFEHRNQRVILQDLVHEPDTPANEVYPATLYDRKAEKVVRKCHLGAFSDDVPAPYNRDGVGDFYYVREMHLSKLATSPAWGWNPYAGPKQSKLIGMGLFCGGGNFDRGIEEGGAVDFRFALDWNESALHSYRANAKHNVNYFLGSANDALARGLAGDTSPVVAKVGEVEFIAAGSPCQGFSNMNSDRLSPSALQNASMVASVVGFVDFYNPYYCILENVLSMTDSMGPNKDQNVFSQMIASLVAMGYQVQQWLGDAWSVGSSQNRSRLFIMASAPGLPLLEPPAQTHSHPPNKTRNKYHSLGRLTNDLTFATRQDNYTHFPHVSPKEATKGLPVLGDVPPSCIPFPDHRTSIRATLLNQRRTSVVPVHPQGMSLALARDAGLLSGEPLSFINRRQGTYKGAIKSFSRIFRDGLFPTIVTRTTVHCRHTGRWLHWEEDRVITVMEARRAQGFLDHEVIVGCASAQMKIVGNSVDRKVALVLGCKLRESWEGWC